MVFKNVPGCTDVTAKIPTRLNIGCMLFMACLTSYMLRVNISINIIAMVKPKINTDNSTTTAAPLPDYGPRYEWDSKEQSLLLGAFFYGYLFTSLPGGVLAEILGGTAVAGYTLAASAILTALTPIAATWNFWSVFVLRFLTGFLGGVIYPCSHNLISKWSPPDEKGKFVSALMGGTFGTVITWPISGFIIEKLGWEWAFYAVAIFCAIIVCLWFYLVADKPEKHKRIRDDEKDYILKSLGDTISKSNSWPPFRKVFISPAFWSLLILHYGSMWGLSFLVTAAPKFVSEVLGFNLAHAGILSSLPHLARLIASFFFGQIGDVIRRRQWLSVTMIRKSFCIFSHIIPGIFLIILAYFGREPYVCVAIMTLSLGFNGAATLTNLQNSQDLAPNYAGTIYGTINFVGTTPGMISPLVVAYFTQDNNTMDEWVNVFLIGAAAYIIPAFIFFIFGSGEVQKWNDPKKTDVGDEPAEYNTKF